LNGEFHLGPWLVQPRLNAIVLDGQAVRLEPKVMQVLVCLARGAGDVVEKENLIRAVWPDTFVSDDALTRCISELRKTFEDDARDSRFIQTIPKIGYRLVAPIREVARPVESPSAPAAEVRRGSVSEVAPPAAVPVEHSIDRWFVAALALLAVIAAALWFHSHSLSAPQESIDSIAVLPFSNATPDPGSDYLSDGIAMCVSNGLSRVPNLKVISQASTSYYRGLRINPTLVGQQLGAQALVTGHLVRKGEDLLINVELINTRDNSHLWGAEYQHPAKEVLALEEEIARDIIANLRLRSAEVPQPAVKRHTSNNESYQLYLQGRYLWNRRTPEGIARSIDYFHQAIAKDPQDALAYAGLADAYNLQSEYNSVPPRVAFPKAKAAAEKALSIDDSLAEAHSSLAMVKCNFDWDFPGAEVEYKRAIALDPNYATAHQWYSQLLGASGRQQESRNEAEKALQLDPLSLIINSNVAKIDSHQKRFEDAQKIIHKLYDIEPQSPLTYAISGDLHLDQGDCPAALADFQKSSELAPGHSGPNEGIAVAYARCGEKDKARAAAEQMEALAKTQYVAPSSIAIVYAWIGDKERTLTYLEKGLAVRDDGVLHFEESPAADLLHNDPRFQKLLKEIKPLD